MRICRLLVLIIALASLLGTACGSGPRAATADLASIRQPTPDPTLDAVVRDLPRVLAGVAAPSPTPTLIPAQPTPPRSLAVPKPKSVVKPTPAPPAVPQAQPTARPTARPIVPTARPSVPTATGSRP